MPREWREPHTRINEVEETWAYRDLEITTVNAYAKDAIEHTFENLLLVINLGLLPEV